MPPRKEGRSARRRSRVRAIRSATPMSLVTIQELVEFLAPGLWGSRQPPAWPPDMFGITAVLLMRSGAYTKIVHEWPPRSIAERPLGRQSWQSAVSGIGRRWRENVSGLSPSPAEIGQLWQVLKRNGRTRLPEISGVQALFESLVTLCAAADEASAGAGIPGGRDDYFQQAAKRLLLSHLLKKPPQRASLSGAIDSSWVLVLPKLHTPQTGMTIRSISHHLSICEAPDIIPMWILVPARTTRSHALNVLLVPWPKRVVPVEFQTEAGPLRNRPREQVGGFFVYRPQRTKERAGKVVRALLEAATEIAGGIDIIVMPELAVSSQDYEDIIASLKGERVFVVCGIGEPPAGRGALGKNYSGVAVPLDAEFGPLDLFQQSKHHRWKLNSRQIIQYGLGARLDHTRDWWEGIDIRERELAFFSVNEWLTFCVLMCEDLSRPDPAGEVIRAVGPNLVITLLMDGPQLTSRWPGRYAGVLADDPGSSVLCLTSQGMAELSRPSAGESRGRVVALWSDARSGFKEIELGRNAEAIVLSLSREMHEEWAADGRSDRGTTGYLVLTGIHQIERKPPNEGKGEGGVSSKSTMLEPKAEVRVEP